MEIIIDNSPLEFISIAGPLFKPFNVPGRELLSAIPENAIWQVDGRYLLSPIIPYGTTYPYKLICKLHLGPAHRLDLWDYGSGERMESIEINSGNIKLNLGSYDDDDRVFNRPFATPFHEEFRVELDITNEADRDKAIFCVTWLSYPDSAANHHDAFTWRAVDPLAFPGEIERLRRTYQYRKSHAASEQAATFPWTAIDASGRVPDPVGYLGAEDSVSDVERQNNARLNRRLLNQFPDVAERYTQIAIENDGDETGCYIMYADLLTPMIRDLFEKRNFAELKRFFDWFEVFLDGSTIEEETLIAYGILESIGAIEELDTALANHLLGPRTAKVWIETEWFWMREEAQRWLELNGMPKVTFSDAGAEWIPPANFEDKLADWI